MIACNFAHVMVLAIENSIFSKIHVPITVNLQIQGDKATKEVKIFRSFRILKAEYSEILPQLLVALPLTYL